MRPYRSNLALDDTCKNCWRLLFDRSQDSMLMLDTEFTVVDINRAAAELCSIGDKLSELDTISSESNERRSIESTVRWTIENNQPSEGRIIYLAKQHANVGIDVYPIERPLRGVVLIIKNSTESLNHDERLQNPDNLLRLGMTAAGITHELSNPLAALYSEIELMQSLQQKPEPHLENCLKLVQRMHHILRELSGAFDTNVSLVEQPIDLEKTINQAIQLLRFYPGNNQIEVQQTYADNLPKLMITEKHLLLLVENICENAIKAAEDNGSIQVTAEGDLDNGINICITNSGIHQNEKNSWPQADQYQQGMGVGLAICMQIMQSYDGQLLISTTEEGDTRVAFKFPPERCYPANLCETVNETKRGEK